MPAFLSTRESRFLFREDAEMKAVNIVGFRNSGKSRLIQGLARALRRRGHSVEIVKHCIDRISISEKDSGFRSAANGYSLFSGKESLVYAGKTRDLDDLLNSLEADYILLEGFKSNKMMPRIVCARTTADKRKLCRGLEIAVLEGTQPISQGHIKKLAATIERKAFKLPGLDCGRCGKPGCRRLALDILKGKAKGDDCHYSDTGTTLSIGGKDIPLSRFPAQIMRKVVLGMLDSLQGTAGKGRIRIEMSGRKRRSGRS